jgi:hypothetical protein
VRPLLVLEETTGPSRRLFRAWGVEWRATRWAWAGPLFWVALGWLVAWAEAVGAGADHGPGVPGGLEPLGVLAVGAAYGALLWLTNGVHTLGHVLAAGVAGTPMDAVLLTSTRDVMVFRGWKRGVAERIRVARSMGGPLANALVGGLALQAARALAGGGPAGAAEPGAAARWLAICGVFNLAVAAWTLAPIPTLDGWIVWRWVFHRGGGAR